MRSAGYSPTTDGPPAEILDVIDGIDPEVWSRTHVVDERGLGGIMVHHLGAAQRWRISLATQGEGEGPEPELEPLPTAKELLARWEEEWAATNEWLPTLTDGFVGHVHEGVPIWQMLVHVVKSRDTASIRGRGPAHV